jgi:hypothetical protein
MEKRPERELEQEAKSVLQSLDHWCIPVDPFAIVKDEGIDLAPGIYGSRFDARIEYLNDVDTFALYYRRSGPGRTEARVRFSVAHELAHYYLHRDSLLAGRRHNSQSDFRSRDPLEQEADEFAAALLMPRELFAQRIQMFRQRVCVLSELCHLAEDVFHTSVTSTVRRYCQCGIEPASMVMSNDGRVKWALASEDMRRLGFGYVEAGRPVPRMSKTAVLLQKIRGGEDTEPVEGGVTASVWFERGYGRRLWEEAMSLGRTGLVLTYLTMENPPE